MSIATTTNNDASFEAFYEAWLARQQLYLDELLCTQQNLHQCQQDYLEELIARALSHYHEYYVQKSRLVSREVFLVFSPTWLTPFERVFFWIAGIRPSLAFGLAACSACDDLTEHQKRRMDNLAHGTKLEERVGEAVGQGSGERHSTGVLPVARWQGRGLTDRVVGKTEAVVDNMRSAMEMVLGRADLLRIRAAQSVVEILNPVQSVKLLTTATQLQLKIRKFGLQKEAQRRREKGW